MLVNSMSGGAPGQRARAAARPPAKAGGWLLLAASLALATVLSVSVASGQSSMEVVGTWGGAVNCVYIQEDVDPWTAYVGSGRRLVILNVEDPANIVELGSIDLGNMVMDVKVRGGYAYASTYSKPNAFCVVDVSDPAAPRMIWHLTSPTNFKGDTVELRDNVAYVVSAIGSAQRLYAFDISDPGNPVSHGIILDYAERPAQAFGVRGNLMYVAGIPASDWEPYVWIYDLSADPYHPALRGSVQLTASFLQYPLALVLEGDYACVTTARDEGLVITVDVSDPDEPMVAGAYTFDDYASFPMVGGLSAGWAYVAEGDLVVLDVGTDPASPQLVGAASTHGRISDVAVFGTRAYAMDAGEGLIVYDLATRGDPVRVGGWHSPADLRKMDKVGDFLYVTDCWNGVTILNVSNPCQPALVGVYQTGEDSGRWGDNWGIAVRDAKAYLSAGAGGVEVVDVSDPAQPAVLSAHRFAEGLSATSMTLNGNIAHVGVRPVAGGYMVNFDVGDPTDIADVGFVGTGSPPLTIDVCAGIASLARDGVGGMLTMVNTADPASPFVLVSGFQGGVDLARTGDLIYMANGHSDVGGLYIIDVSDPANPSEAGQFAAVQASAVAHAGDSAYLVALYGGLRQVLKFDVTDASAPVLRGCAPIPGGQNCLLVDGRYIYVTGGYGDNSAVGLAIIEMPATAGDLNCDGAVNAFDIDPFVLALTDTTGYAAALPGCDRMAADCSGDGEVNAFDIDAFVALLVGA